MISSYDVFYVIANKGELRIIEILKILNKPRSIYQSVFNKILKLEKKGYIKRGKTVKILHNNKTKKLFELISFCISNKINYNLMFKPKMLNFICEAYKKELFTINEIKIHPQTFKFYTDALNQYGFLLIILKKPLRCKLLRHHFLIDLMKFFMKKREFYVPKKISLIKNIKKELTKYKENLKIHHNILADIENKEEIGFIHSSLNLEGNPLTLPETEKLIIKKVVPEKHKLFDIQEVTNYKKAVDLMIINTKNKKELSLELILKYHKLAMPQLPTAGKVRKQNVIIKLNPLFKTSDWNSIIPKLNKLMKKHKDFTLKKWDLNQIISFSAFFHNEFQRIHPFIDGNSRISRLLLMHILRNQNIPILDLPIGYFDLYLDLTKRSKQRDDKSFKHLIEEIILMNLRKVNDS